MSGTAYTCRIHWPRLYLVVSGVRHAVEPTPADTPTSVLFRTWCAGCGAEYTYPFRVIDPPEQRAA
jgi:hypothetical protein